MQPRAPRPRRRRAARGARPNTGARCAGEAARAGPRRSSARAAGPSAVAAPEQRPALRAARAVRDVRPARRRRSAASSAASRSGARSAAATNGQRERAGLPERLLDEAGRARPRRGSSPELHGRLEPAGVREAAGGERGVGELEDEPGRHRSEQEVPLRERQPGGRLAARGARRRRAPRTSPDRPPSAAARR